MRPPCVYLKFYFQLPKHFQTGKDKRLNKLEPNSERNLARLLQNRRNKRKKQDEEQRGTSTMKCTKNKGGKWKNGLHAVTWSWHCDTVCMCLSVPTPGRKEMSFVVVLSSQFHLYFIISERSWIATWGWSRLERSLRTHTYATCE